MLEFSRLENSLQEGKDVSTKILFEAVIEGNSWLFAYWLESGADKNARNEKGMSLLYVATRERRHKIVELLLNADADVNAKTEVGDQTALYCAAYNGDFKSAKLLLEKGANPNTRIEGGCTALHRAVYNGYLEIVTLLLEAEVDVDAKSEEGYAALHFGALSESPKRVEIIKLLLGAGADLTAKSEKGNTPLQLAIVCENKEVEEVLRSFQASKEDPIIQYLKETTKISCWKKAGGNEQQCKQYVSEPPFCNEESAYKKLAELPKDCSFLPSFRVIKSLSQPGAYRLCIRRASIPVGHI